jgi:hypothetical protein
MKVGHSCEFKFKKYREDKNGGDGGQKDDTL